MVVMPLISYSRILFTKSPLGSTYTHLIECIYTSVSSAMNFAFYMNIQGLKSDMTDDHQSCSQTLPYACHPNPILSPVCSTLDLASHSTDFVCIPIQPLSTSG